MKTWIVITFSLFSVICDGRSQPEVVQVGVQQLIANPDKFNGKSISATGYYVPEHHGAYLASNPKGEAGALGIHLDFRHTSLSSERLKRVQYGYVRVLGTFEYRNTQMRISKDGTIGTVAAGFGWMNVYDKQITNIIVFENVPAPKR